MILMKCLNNDALATTTLFRLLSQGYRVPEGTGFYGAIKTTGTPNRLVCWAYNLPFSKGNRGGAL